MDPASRPDRQAIVLRFPPGGADEIKTIMKEAKYISRRYGQGCRLSVWVSSQADGETDEETVVRLVRSAEINDLRVGDERNSRLWWTRASNLYDAGFDLVKDGYPGEADEHYSVMLGNEVSRAIVEKFAGCFPDSAETKGFLG